MSLTMVKTSEPGAHETHYLVEGRYDVHKRWDSWRIEDAEGEFHRIGPTEVYVTRAVALDCLKRHIEDPVAAHSKTVAEKEEEEARREEVRKKPVAERSFSVSFFRCGGVNHHHGRGRQVMCGECGGLHYTEGEDTLTLQFKVADALATEPKVIEKNWSEGDTPANMREAEALEVIEQWQTKSPREMTGR